VSTTVEKVTLALTPALAAAVRAAVAGGGYASTSEVVRDALRLWRRRRALEALEALELAELRRAAPSRRPTAAAPTSTPRPPSASSRPATPPAQAAQVTTGAGE
jgi:antitoxin ParD1/3/4